LLPAIGCFRRHRSRFNLPTGPEARHERDHSQASCPNRAHSEALAQGRARDYTALALQHSQTW